MTISQYLASAMALFFTLYYAPALWRSDQRISGPNVVIWTLSVLACAIAFLGVSP